MIEFCTTGDCGSDDGWFDAHKRIAAAVGEFADAIGEKVGTPWLSQTGKPAHGGFPGRDDIADAPSDGARRRRNLTGNMDRQSQAYYGETDTWAHMLFNGEFATINDRRELMLGRTGQQDQTDFSLTTLRYVCSTSFAARAWYGGYRIDGDDSLTPSGARRWMIRHEVTDMRCLCVAAHIARPDGQYKRMASNLGVLGTVIDTETPWDRDIVRVCIGLGSGGNREPLPYQTIADACKGVVDAGMVPMLWTEGQAQKWPHTQKLLASLRKG